jgi:PII-like signaling protein
VPCCGPIFFVDQIRNQPTELHGVLKLILGLREDQTEHALPFAKLFQEMPVVVE